MKIIGLIGGMSWESTVPYYSQILCLGVVKAESRTEYRRIMAIHARAAAETALGI